MKRLTLRDALIEKPSHLYKSTIKNEFTKQKAKSTIQTITESISQNWKEISPFESFSHRLEHRKGPVMDEKWWLRSLAGAVTPGLLLYLFLDSYTDEMNEYHAEQKRRERQRLLGENVEEDIEEREEKDMIAVRDTNDKENANDHITSSSQNMTSSEASDTDIKLLLARIEALEQAQQKQRSKKQTNRVGAQAQSGIRDRVDQKKIDQFRREDELARKTQLSEEEENNVGKMLSKAWEQVQEYIFPYEEKKDLQDYFEMFYKMVKVVMTEKGNEIIQSGKESATAIYEKGMVIVNDYRNQNTQDPSVPSEKQNKNTPDEQPSDLSSGQSQS